MKIWSVVPFGAWPRWWFWQKSLEVVGMGRRSHRNQCIDLGFDMANRQQAPQSMLIYVLLRVRRIGYHLSWGKSGQWTSAKKHVWHSSSTVKKLNTAFANQHLWKFANVFWFDSTDLSRYGWYVYCISWAPYHSRLKTRQGLDTSIMAPGIPQSWFHRCTIPMSRKRAILGSFRLGRATYLPGNGPVEMGKSDFHGFISNHEMAWHVCAPFHHFMHDMFAHVWTTPLSLPLSRCRVCSIYWFYGIQTHAHT